VVPAADGTPIEGVCAPPPQPASASDANRSIDAPEAIADLIDACSFLVNRVTAVLQRNLNRA
jgi:hypothetical protein